MAEVPSRLGPTLLGTSTTTVISAGISGWRIVRSILVANETASEITVTVGIGTSNSDAIGKHILPAVKIPAANTLVLSEASFFIPLLGGAIPDVLYAFCSVNNGATITVGTVDGP